MRNIAKIGWGGLRIPNEQIECFRTRGYICVRDCLPASLVCDLRSISDQLSSLASSILTSSQAAGMSLFERARTRPRELIVVPEKTLPTQVCRYEFMMGSSSDFKELVVGCFQDAVSELVGEGVVPFKDKTNEKLPGGGAFTPHQDFAAYRAFKPRYHATTLLTIDLADARNGCVQFATNLNELITAKPAVVLDTVDGKALLHYYDGGPHHGDIRTDISRQLKWQPLETRPGDLVVFDSFSPHYSAVNKSANRRRAIFVTFTRASEGRLYDEYYADKRLNYDDPKFHVSTPTTHR